MKKTRKVYPRWTKAELKSLSSMRQQGLSYRQCAEKLGRTMNACQLAYYRIRHSKLPLPAERVSASASREVEVRLNLQSARYEDGSLILKFTV